MKKTAFGFALGLAASILLSGQTPGASLEVTLRLTTPGLSPGAMVMARPSSHAFSVRGRRLASEPPPAERIPEWSEDRLVVDACAPDGRRISRISVIDPRLLRAEAADENGRMSTQNLYRTEVEFTLALPADPDIRLLRLFQPIWDGRAFELVLLGEILLEAGR